ncbi:MAG: hypothetical protein IIX80_01350 [Clostridia bacterium]|nr:hypothetical protein [Clostridia bacterium]
MKKILYCMLLGAELFVGTLLMIALCNSSLYIPVALVVLAMVALLTWQIKSFRKTEDPARRRKILLRIALILLIPGAVFMITYIAVAIAFIIAFI